ncbi:discoidin domain-containing protein [Paenibacillus sp. HWE-109]|uniref:discoidin domain-containing protein n=1 Tax=Paenibacillus sp. HWE-109 TaxID=1306526 RepID=UPI001EDF560D|nr:discoidin domain-containing protein [Paenibacillus sp. HWE-109]UKS28683.1 discoidin domain-containing protein [Paenibacillus sp. HWE-109]
MSVLLANLALHRTVTCSSESADAASCHAVDGDMSTLWQPLGSDRMDDNRVWLMVDLGQNVPFNQVNLKLASGFISGYRILYSPDNLLWQTAFQRDASRGGISTQDIALFSKVAGRYVKLEVDLFDPERDFQLIQLEIHDNLDIPTGPLLERVILCDPQFNEYEDEVTLTLQTNSQLKLHIKGILTNGEEADLVGGSIAFESRHSGVASIDEMGNLTTHKVGVAHMKATVTWQGVTKETSIFIDVNDPSEPLADIWLTHPAMAMEIGHPAIIAAGSSFPELHIMPADAMTVKAVLLHAATGEALAHLHKQQIEALTEYTFPFPGRADQAGTYQLRVELFLTDELIFYDAFYFTVLDRIAGKAGQSQIVYLGESGKLTYVPDYKGNQILDFSNSGYGGGGILIPFVEPVLSLSAVDGDNTEHIQNAINLVAAWPQSAEGLRGTILLRKGIYRVSGSLKIEASGIVLRGEGTDENGTLLYATGKLKRNLIEIAGTSAPGMLPDTHTTIIDLYVPAGSRSIHVRNASNFSVGNKVKVLRFGNERWIHAIGMDTIRMRPVAGGTVQWPPFHLEFDRVITHIEGNCLQLDAPIANAIEKQWGWGSVVKYEDSGRIEHVGVENMRVDVEYDPSITDTRIDGNEGNTVYLADEDHAINFIYMDNVTNSWVRDIVGLHLQHALVQVGRNAKWVTIQDCVVLAFISVITGGRRYPFHLMGELTLVQRAYTETARHAFAVDARVAGPNVFLDSESTLDYNTSEPHHRWSVGCLYDNVNGRIHIQDRGWLGSGQGWAGANYVAWNTTNELVSQQPPTAQNYAIGHVGRQGKPLLPCPYDPRERKQAYWESLGQHVTPRSLYVQQLMDRLGPEAVANIQGGIDR